MFRVVLFFLLLVPHVSFAEIPELKGAYVRSLMQTQIMLAQQGLLGSSSSTDCSAFRQNPKEIKILLAFGYMDVSHSSDFRDSAENLYHLGDVLDGDARSALESILTSSCKGTFSQSKIYRACDFRKSGSRFTKSISSVVTGKTLKISIEIVSASVSSNDALNRNQYFSDQQKKTNNAKQKFYEGVSSADVAVYLGHARSGGGPDFAPPVYRGDWRVDYSSYLKKREGYGLTLRGLKARSHRGTVALLACRSTPLFSDGLVSVAQGSTIVTANQLFDYNSILPTGLALIEGVMAEKCGKGLAPVLRASSGSGMISVF